MKPYWDTAYPFAITLLFLWLFIRLVYGHVLELIELIFKEIHALISLQPSRKAINLFGTIFLFVLILLVLLDGTLEFLYGHAGLVASGASHFSTTPVDHDPFVTQ